MIARIGTVSAVILFSLLLCTLNYALMHDSQIFVDEAWSLLEGARFWLAVFDGSDESRMRFAATDSCNSIGMAVTLPVGLIYHFGGNWSHLRLVAQAYQFLYYLMVGLLALQLSGAMGMGKRADGLLIACIAALLAILAAFGDVREYSSWILGEVPAASFCLLALWLRARGRDVAAAVALGAAVTTKNLFVYMTLFILSTAWVGGWRHRLKTLCAFLAPALAFNMLKFAVMGPANYADSWIEFYRWIRESSGLVAGSDLMKMEDQNFYSLYFTLVLICALSFPMAGALWIRGKGPGIQRVWWQYLSFAACIVIGFLLWRFLSIYHWRRRALAFVFPGAALASAFTAVYLRDLLGRLPRNRARLAAVAVMALGAFSFAFSYQRSMRNIPKVDYSKERWDVEHAAKLHRLHCTSFATRLGESLQP